MSMISKLPSINCGDPTWIASSMLLTRDKGHREGFVHACLTLEIWIAWLHAEIGRAEDDRFFKGVLWI